MISFILLKFSFAFLIFLLFINVECACPFDRYDVELTNDDFETASVPFIGRHTSLTLCDDDDDENDWYRTWIKPGGTLRIEIELSEPSFQNFISLSIHDDSGKGSMISLLFIFLYLIHSII